MLRYREAIILHVASIMSKEESQRSDNFYWGQVIMQNKCLEYRHESM